MTPATGDFRNRRTRALASGVSRELRTREFVGSKSVQWSQSKGASQENGEKRN